MAGFGWNRWPVSRGLCTNLCEALSSLLRAMEGSTLEARFGWARNRPLPPVVPGPLRLLPDTIPILDAVAREFRAREPQPDFELRGPILELASEDPTRGGTPTIGGALDNRVVRVRVPVGRVETRVPSRLMKKRGVVLAEGELVREGRSFALRNARNFSVEMDE